jgi:hypothetical protein
MRVLAKYITFEPAGTLGFGIETMRITNGTQSSAGSVGIGTNSPSAMLHVNGTVSLASCNIIGALTGTSATLTGGPGGTLTLGSTAAVQYTLPNADGAAGYTLQTNGSGTVTWAAGGGGGGSGTVTSVATGTGLTGGPITSTGTISIAGTFISSLPALP